MSWACSGPHQYFNVPMPVESLQAYVAAILVKMWAKDSLRTWGLPNNKVCPFVSVAHLPEL